MDNKPFCELQMELDHSSRGVIVTGSRPDPNYLFTEGMELFRIEQAYLKKYICRFQQTTQNTRSLAWGRKAMLTLVLKFQRQHSRSCYLEGLLVCASDPLDPCEGLHDPAHPVE